jgi:hypothetical protein
MAESYHWRLDVTFREDENHTIEKQAAFNLNIMRKLALNVPRIFEVRNKRLSLNEETFYDRCQPRTALRIPSKLIMLQKINSDRRIRRTYLCVCRGVFSTTNA